MSGSSKSKDSGVNLQAQDKRPREVSSHCFQYLDCFACNDRGANVVHDSSHACYSTDLSISLQYFRQDPESCTVGTILATGEYRPKTNFYIELDTFVESQMAGFFATVKRKSDGETR